MAAARYSLNKNKYLLAPEVERLRKILIDFSVTDLRNCLIMDLALRTGGRATELLELRKQDLNGYDQTVYIRGIKGSNDREIPLHPAFYAKLSRYADGITGSKLFDITYDRLYQIWGFYRPVPKKFHSLRHTFAIELTRRPGIYV